MNILARDFLLLLDLLLILYTLHYIITTVRVQECIPVGCVPSATVAVCCWKGGACSGGGGACSRPGEGMPAPGGGGGDGISACTEEDPPCGQTDRCKNITFATSLRTVISCTTTRI